MSSLQGKVIAITGAASGIGLALTKLAAARGAKLALADVQQQALDELVTQLKSSGTEAVGTCLNVTKSDEVDNWINSTKEHFGRLDGAANIAGVSGKREASANIWDQMNEEWDFILSVNLTGLMYCMRAQVRVMEKGASIVNAASVAGLIGRPGLGAYCASKHGVIGLTKTAAKEVGPAKGIRVNAVAPGPIDTPMLQRVLASAPQTSSGFANAYNSLPLGRKGEAEEVAEVFAFLLSDASAFTTGSVYTVDGGLVP